MLVKPKKSQNKLDDSNIFVARTYLVIGMTSQESKISY